MKKAVIIISFLVLPALAWGFASCYQTWSSQYDQAESQYEQDVWYCYNRMIDFYVVACFKYAQLDFQNTVDQITDQYYGCLGISRQAPGGGSTY